MFRSKQICTLNMPGAALDACLVRLLKQSQETGEWTAELLQARGGWKRGDKIQVKQWELLALNQERKS